MSLDIPLVPLGPFVVVIFFSVEEVVAHGGHSHFLRGTIECGEICSCHCVTSPDMVKMACIVYYGFVRECLDNMIVTIMVYFGRNYK